MTGWQPIETAPKDETGVLLFYPEVDRKIPSGIIEGWYFSSPKEIDDGWETIIGSIGEPTHWQPLPPPPTVSVEEEIESLLQDMRWKPPATVAVTAGEGGEWIEFGANNPTLIHSIKFADGSKWDSFNGWRPYKLPPPPTAREECICWMDIQSKDCPVHGNNPSPGGEEDEICCETIGNSNFCIRHNRDIHQCIIKAGAGKLNPSPSDLSTVKERGKNVTQFSDIEGVKERLGGPHEWGYRDVVDGTFITDDTPFDALRVIEQLEQEKFAAQCETEATGERLSTKLTAAQARIEELEKEIERLNAVLLSAINVTLERNQAQADLAKCGEAIKIIETQRDEARAALGKET